MVTVEYFIEGGVKQVVFEDGFKENFCCHTNRIKSYESPNGDKWTMDKKDKKNEKVKSHFVPVGDKFLQIVYDGKGKVVQKIEPDGRKTFFKNGEVTEQKKRE